MAYMKAARGDYMGQQGDYYSGDPGFFSDLFHGITHIVGGAVGGLLTAGPIGGILGAVKGTISAVRQNSAAAVADAASGDNPGVLPALPPPPGGVGIMAPGGGRGGIVTTSPLGTPVSPAAIARQVAAQGGGVRRHHPNKSTYITRGGGTSHWAPGLQVHIKGTELVPSRRMNVANPRALRRALRRTAGFAKLTKRVRRAVSMAASAVGVHRRASKKKR